MIPADWKNQIDSTSTVLKLTHVTDDDVINHIVPFLELHPNLTHVSLKYGTITVEGAKALAAVRHITNLNLIGNDLGNKGAIALAASSHIKNLNLRLNGIGDKGAKVLAANTHITTLNLGHNKLSFEGEQALEEINPLTRAKTCNSAGVTCEVPSIVRFTLFELKKHKSFLNEPKLAKILPADKFEQLQEPKV